MKRRTSTKLGKWAKGKPLGLVMIAQQFAISAEPCFEFLRLVKAGERVEGYSSLPKVNEWLSLCSDNHRLESYTIASPSAELAKGLGSQIFDSMT